jgi:hypothetical protein
MKAAHRFRPGFHIPWQAGNDAARMKAGRGSESAYWWLEGNAPPFFDEKGEKILDVYCEGTQGRGLTQPRLEAMHESLTRQGWDCGLSSELETAMKHGAPASVMQRECTFNVDVCDEEVTAITFERVVRVGHAWRVLSYHDILAPATTSLGAPRCGCTKCCGDLRVRSAGVAGWRGFSS